MTLWRPLPCAVGEDLRLLSLDAPAQAVAFRLASRAVGGVVTVGHDVNGAVVAMCGGGAWARDGFEALESAGLASVEGESVVLAWEWPTMRGEAPPLPVAPASRAVAPSDDSTARARLRALFSKHGLKDAPARLAWLNSDKGRDTVARLGLSEGSARDLAGSARSNRCNPDVQPNVTGDVTGCNLSSNLDVTSLQPVPPSQTLPPKETEKEERNTESGAREARSNLEATKAVTSKQPDVTDGGNQGATSSKGKRGKGKPAPYVDTPPMLGTLAHRVYLAIVNDPLLCPIVGNPGDFAARLADPDAYPGVDVLAEVKRAGGFVAGKPAGHWTDGRAALARWMRAEAEKVAARPKPADARPVQPARVVEAPPVAAPLYIVPMTPEQKARQPRTLAEYEARVEAEEAARKAAENGR